jgi:hypothetical protein
MGRAAPKTNRRVGGRGPEVDNRKVGVLLRQSALELSQRAPARTSSVRLAQSSVHQLQVRSRSLHRLTQGEHVDRCVVEARGQARQVAFGSKGRRRRHVGGDAWTDAEHGVQVGSRRVRVDRKHTFADRRQVDR